MNIEDYYKILNLRSNAGQFKIAIHYLKLVNSNYHMINNKTNKECFFRVNIAIEILRNEATRKYYNIIYNETRNNTLDENNPEIQKYLKIVNKAVSIGKYKANLLLTDSEYRKQSGKIQSPIIFWLNFLVYLNPGRILLHKYITIPILDLTYIIFGLMLIFSQIENFNSEYLIIGIIISLFGISTLYLNFEKYIFDMVKR